MARSYLDHASTSPLRPAARDALVEFLDSGAADPGRIHHEGMAARVALETAREQVAAAFGARPREVVFTSGATEAIAAASYGARERDPARQLVLSSPVEHSAVREWSARGAHHDVGVDEFGRVDVEEIAARIDDHTALVHLQWGNHEVGTRQPVTEVIDAVKDSGALLHVDAAQAGAFEAIDFRSSGIDLLSLSGHKLGAPTGIGALLVRRGLRIPPLLVGGDQERARRAGLENVAAAVAFGAAADDVARRRAEDEPRMRELTSQILQWASTCQDVTVLGDPEDRLAHIVCLGLVGIEPQPVLLGLDQAGVAVHSGSSCSSEALEPSPVLEAMGVDSERSLRISTGWTTEQHDIDALIRALESVLDHMRSLMRR